MKTVSKVTVSDADASNFKIEVKVVNLGNYSESSE